MLGHGNTEDFRLIGTAVYKLKSGVGQFLLMCFRNMLVMLHTGGKPCCLRQHDGGVRSVEDSI